jgi:hypothetical protein
LEALVVENFDASLVFSFQCPAFAASEQQVDNDGVASSKP